MAVQSFLLRKLFIPVVATSFLYAHFMEIHACKFKLYTFYDMIQILFQSIIANIYLTAEKN